MTPLEFLRTVWPDTGLYCICVPYPNSDALKHHIFETIEEAAAFAETKKEHRNVFYATHALREPRVWGTVRNYQTKEWEPGWQYRTQANMRAGRELFFDLDVGESTKDKKKYPTQGAAVAALKQFVTATGLPRPTIVSSGGGIHVHWPLASEMVSNTDWVKLAAKLRQLATHHNIWFDSTRTTDTASVLRVVGTYNLKNGNRRPVEAKYVGRPTAPEDMQALIDAARGAAGITQEPLVRAEAPKSILGSNIEQDYPRPKIKNVLQICPQMLRVAKLKGDVPEPEWYKALQVVRCTDNGDEHCQKISSGYAGYDPREVQDRVDRLKAKNIGAPTCASIEDAMGPTNKSLCDRCHHSGTTDKGPIQLALQMKQVEPAEVAVEVDGQEVTYEIPAPPDPYRRGPQGGVHILAENAEGETYLQLVYPYDFYPIGRASNARAETEQQVWRAHLPHRAPAEFTISASCFSDNKALTDRLANLGIYVSPNQFPKMRQYMSAYIQHLQRTQPADAEQENLGWSGDHKSFVLPRYTMHEDGSTKPTVPSVRLRPTLDTIRTAGSAEVQIELLKFFRNPDYCENQFMILAGMASPLFHFTGLSGVTIHAFGKGGESKSTSLYTVAALWGPPIKYTLNGTGQGATQFARNTTQSLLHNLPVCIDEITHLHADVCKDMVMGVTQGNDKVRGYKDGSISSGTDVERSSIMISTGNSSLQQKISVNNFAALAGAMRIFEIECHEKSVHKPRQAERYLTVLKKNHGHVGPMIVKYMVMHHETLDRRVNAELNRVADKFISTPTGRYWRGACACVLVMFDIATEIGVIDWDKAAFEHWLFNVQLPRMMDGVQAEQEAKSSVTVLTNFLEASHGHTIITEEVAFGEPHERRIERAPTGALYVHVDTKDRTILVLKDQFKRWCDSRGENAMTVLRDLFGRGIVTQYDIKRTLGAGTAHAKGRSICILIAMDHPELSGKPALVRMAPQATAQGATP